MGFMDFLDPGGAARSFLNLGGIADPFMPYLGSAGTTVGSIIGGTYGGPAGAALVGGLGGFGGEEMGRYLSHDPNYERNPFTGESLKPALTTGLLGAGAGYAGTSLAGALSGSGTAGAGGGISGASATGSGVPSSVLGSSLESASFAPETSSIISGASPASMGLEQSAVSSMIPSAAPDAAKSSGLLGGFGGKAMPYLAGAGLLSNLGGQLLGSEQQKSNLGDYIGATTWTPEKASTYLGSIGQSTAGTLGADAARRKGTLAESMATAGRGGGGYGKGVMGIDEQTLNAIANARNQALTTVSQPPNLSPSPFMSQTNPYASTLTGIGGTAGNLMTQMATMEMMRKLGLFNNSGATA